MERVAGNLSPATSSPAGNYPGTCANIVLGGYLDPNYVRSPNYCCSVYAELSSPE